jgi:hypothetical protein
MTGKLTRLMSSPQPSPERLILWLIVVILIIVLIALIFSLFDVHID